MNIVGNRVHYYNLLDSVPVAKNRAARAKKNDFWKNRGYKKNI